MSQALYRCQCGEWTGDHCPWTGPLADMVVIEYMPEYLRVSLVAALFYSGTYPHNGAVRLAVSRPCAEFLLEGEDDWASVVAGANPGDHVEVAG